MPDARHGYVLLMTEEPPKRMTPQERQQAKRDERLANVQEQVDNGSLTIRKVSDEERAAWEEKQKNRPPNPRKRR